MKRHISIIKAGAIFAPAAFLVLLLCVPVRAQDMDNRVLLDRITQLEAQVQDISRKAYGSSYVPGQVSNVSGNGSAAPVSTDTLARISGLESQIRDLTGQMERATFQSQKNAADLDKLKSDLDLRLQALEQKKSVPMDPAAQNAPTDLPAPDQTADAAAPVSDQAVDPATPEELYNRSYGELQQKQYDAAEKDFRNFLAKNAGNKLAPNAEYWLGETYFARGNYKAASAVFAESYQKYPKAIKAPDSLLKLGLSLEQQSRTKDACTVLRQLTKEYPTATGTIATRTEMELKKLKCQ